VFTSVCVNLRKILLTKINKIISENSCWIENGSIFYPHGSLKLPNGLCLDLGCGNFNFELEYKTKVVGIDKEKLSNSKNFIHGDLRDVNVWNKLDNNSFSCITSLASLHWIKEIDFILEQCNKKLAPKGKIFHFLWHENNFQYPIFELLTNFSKATVDDMLITNVEKLSVTINNAGFKILDIFSYKTKFYINEINLIEKINAEYRPMAEFIILIAEKI
jgi:SAM-dependent methyltransferase